MSKIFGNDSQRKPPTTILSMLKNPIAFQEDLFDPLFNALNLEPREQPLQPMPSLVLGETANNEE